MANKIEATELETSSGDVLKAIDIVGLTDSLGAPGSYTCYRRLDPFHCEIGILPGNFSAKEVADLFKAAALIPTEDELPRAA